MKYALCLTVYSKDEDTDEVDEEVVPIEIREFDTLEEAKKLGLDIFNTFNKEVK